MKKFLKYFLYGLGALTVGLIILVVIELISNEVTSIGYIRKATKSVQRMMSLTQKFKDPSLCAAYSERLECGLQFMKEIGDYRTVIEPTYAMVGIVGICMKGPDKKQKIECLNFATLKAIQNVQFSKIITPRKSRVSTQTALNKIDKELMDMFLRKMREKMVHQYGKDELQDQKKTVLEVIAEIDKKLIELPGY